MKTKEPETWTQKVRDPDVTEQTKDEAQRDDALKSSESDFKRNKKGGSNVNS